MKQWNCLAHHVTSHQSTVTVIMLKERNKTCRNRSNLLWRHVHQTDIVRRYNREISGKTTVCEVAFKCTVLVKRSISLNNKLSIFLFCCKEDNFIIIHINLGITDLTIRCFDKAKLVNSGISTKRRNKTNVWTFRRLDRTQATIVSIVDVTNLEARTFTRKTARTKS